MMRMSAGSLFLVLIGCASVPRPVTMNDLEGSWKGTWAWKGRDGSTDGGGATLTLKRIDDTSWMLDAVIPNGRTGLPGDRLTLAMKQVATGELAGEMMGGTMKLALVP